MAEHAYDEFDLAASRPEAAVRSFGIPVRSDATPESWDDLERYPEYDFGPLRVRVPVEAELRMADSNAMYSDAAYFVFPDGKVRLSVLAAPRGGHLWPQRAEEIATMQANLGADVRAYTGEWGQELQITDDGETNWVIGVDGPRWMLLGRSTCSVGADTDLADTMRDMIRSSVVFRGNEPLPVRTPLPLREPGTFVPEDTAEDRTETPYAGVVTLIMPKIEAPVTDAPTTRQANTGAGNGAVAGNGDGLAAGPRHILDPAAEAQIAPAPVGPAVANPDWAIAARAASNSGSAGNTAPSDGRSAPVEPAPEARVQPSGDDELGRRRLATVADTDRGAPRSRGGLLGAAALVLVVAVAGLVFALRGSTPGTPEPSLASPQQVNEKQSYPDDAYAATPKAPKVVTQAPVPQAAPPLAAGPALKGAAPVPGVPGAKPVAPRVAAPVRSNPAPANAAARPLPNASTSANSSAAARKPATSTSRSTAPAAAGPAPSRQAASDDYTDSQPRDSRLRSRGNNGRDNRGEDDGPLGALSDDVLHVVPGLG